MTAFCAHAVYACVPWTISKQLLMCCVDNFHRFQADEIHAIRSIVHPILQAEWDLRCVYTRVVSAQSSAQLRFNWRHILEQLKPDFARVSPFFQVSGASAQGGREGGRDHEEREYFYEDWSCCVQTSWVDHCHLPCYCHAGSPGYLYHAPSLGHWPVSLFKVRIAEELNG